MLILAAISFIVFFFFFFFFFVIFLLFVRQLSFSSVLAVGELVPTEVEPELCMVSSEAT